MKARAYLDKHGLVSVVPLTEPQPAEYVAAMDVDTGAVEDWRFMLLLAEKKMHDKYTIVDGKAAEIEKHCGDKTVRIDKKRYNVGGEKHVCKNRRPK